MKMTELSELENSLLSDAIQLTRQIQNNDTREKLFEIFKTYSQVHSQYAALAQENIEALKRGLFIQWYSMTEPSFLTGIGDLDKGARFTIIEILNRKIENDDLDLELEWMLNYYSNFPWAFEEFKEYKGLARVLANRQDKRLPVIDPKHMKTRGQMGHYWISVTQK